MSGDGKDNEMAAADARLKINITPASASGVRQSSPFSQLGAKTSNEGQSDSAHASGSVGNARKRPATEIDPASAAATPARKPMAARGKQLEDFADRILRQIFRITVDVDRLDDGHGRWLTYLPQLAAELAEDGRPIMLSADVLDSAILEAATAWPQEKPLMDYLLPCWKRVVRAIRTLREKDPQKEAVLKEAKRLCMSNCIFALTLPDLFG